jgi:uncharacterized protein (DUF1778 family)
MPRVAIEDNSRFAMRIPPAAKARLMRAAALEPPDLEDFMLRKALRAADAVIEHAERVAPSERDTRLRLDLLDNPGEPNARLPSRRLLQAPAQRVRLREQPRLQLGRRLGRRGQ